MQYPVEQEMIYKTLHRKPKIVQNQKKLNIINNNVKNIKYPTDGTVPKFLGKSYKQETKQIPVTHKCKTVHFP